MGLSQGLQNGNAVGWATHHYNSALITSFILQYLKRELGNDLGPLAHTATIRSLAWPDEMRRLAFLDPMTNDKGRLLQQP